MLVLAGRLALPLVSLPPALFAGPRPELEFLDRNGEPLRAVRPDDGPFTGAVAYGEIPACLVQATLAAEDRRFWRHSGVDWHATIRAAWQLVRYRRVVSGGSTITQQLIKLVELRPRTFRTKFIETAQAARLEQVWDKQRILAEYLARLDYGNFNRGCGAAAQFYFAKPLRDLSPAECALLAALPQAPSRLNPYAHFERACKRQRWILGRMRLAGWLEADQFERAKAEPLRLAAPRRVFEAPHFIDLLLTEAEKPGASPELAGSLAPIGRMQIANLRYSRLQICATALASAPNPGSAETKSGARSVSSRITNHASRLTPIRTTLDLALNRFAERTLRQHLAQLKAQHVSNGSIVVLDSQSGEVLALVGSENYFAPAAGQVNGAWAPRSAGSTFKPFTYLLALERGATPATVVADVPAQFTTPTGVFAPVNYNRHCYGPMRYRLALANSLNISAVKVLASIGGPAPLQQLLQQCGLSTLGRPADDYGLGLTIGNAEARLLEMANAYACLARLGRYQPYRLLMTDGASMTNDEIRNPTPINREQASVRNPKSEGSGASTLLTLQRCNAPPARRIADPTAAYLITDILSDNDARTLAFGAESPLRFDFPVACKTGTSSDFRDNWAFGYTPEFTVGVWVGNFDGSSMLGVSGVTGAAPILHELFEHLHQTYGTTWYPIPTNIVECWIHPVTGQRLGAPTTSRSSPAQRDDEAPISSPPPYPGAIKEKFLASNLPPPESSAQSTPVHLDGEYRDWLASSDNWLGSRAVLASGPDALRILFPPPGATLYLDGDLPEQGRRIPLRAAGQENLEWSSDSLQIAREGNRQIALLSEGRHTITVRDPLSGVQAQTWIDVVVK